ncbi:GDP-mannose 6-dehydrogenase [Luteimonas sp. J16]|jgi:GDP-mannose 6-dehydrogenase|uniref:nucleotide sugar dehydrogenase n=1 Tax=unclassified Luteimonas TaxID=2629088 RepID=UPI0004B81F23|nr:MULTISPECIES: nucleotide sugar dehydrogenase [unclassified Luteimonas]TWG88004.1 GDP-mannose 6-dehydrogenase [Luteimonas sp. J16]
MSNVAVFGLGYVGCVTGACLARDGHAVIGVDIDADKVAEINAGQAPIRENGLDELVAEQVAAGRLAATTDTAEAVAKSDIAMIAVGTPSMDDGSVTTHVLEAVVRSIGKALRAAPKSYHVVIRSTLLPGLLETQMRPALDEELGPGFPAEVVLCNNPEFLREGSALKDYYHPPYVLVGAEVEAHARPVLDLYAAVEAGKHVTDPRTAALVKYACNNFHAVKVAFANEIGAVAKAMGADGHAVMRLVCEDTKLNISPAYMRPGFAFGGSCLPKDLRAINRFAEHAALRLNLLPSVMASNENQLKRALKMVRDEGSRKIGLVGLSFKNGTDDLRESPMVEMVETLTGWGYSVKIYDPNVSLGRLRGRNLSYIDRHLPHLAQMLVSEPEEVLEHAELLLLCTDVANAHDWRGQAKGRVFDLRTDLARPVEPAPEAPRQRAVAAA